MSNNRFQLLPTNTEGQPVFESTPRRGISNTRAIDIYSPDLCDQTTWYQQTTPANYVLTPSPDRKTWFAQNHDGHVWFDVMSCTMQEGRLIMPDSSFRQRSDFYPVFKHNGEPVSWTDIASVDYHNKTVTFNTPKEHNILFEGHKVDKAQHLEFIVAPSYGMEIFVAYAEIQFSLDMDLDSMNKAVRLEILSGLGNMLTKNPPDPYPIPFHMIPFEHGKRSNVIYDIFAYLGVYKHAPNNLFSYHIGTRQDYYRTQDFENHSNVGKNIIPPWGGRDYSTIEFPFTYLSGIPLKGSQFLGIRLMTIDTGPGSEGPLSGKTGTVSFYTEWAYEQG